LALAQTRLAEIEQMLAELARMRDTLRGLVRKWHGDGSLESCPIIETVISGTASFPIKVHQRRTA
jgi:hypothetical protein